MNKNLLLAEAQLANNKIKDEGIYNVETNNSFEILAKKVKTESETINKDAKNGKLSKETKRKWILLITNNA